MKLLLTSNGLSSKKIKKELLKLLIKPAEENKVLIMYTTKSKKYKKSLRKINKQLISLGIKKQNLIYANISRKVGKLSEFDVFYSCGGNAFYILDRIRKTSFDKIIKNHIKQEKLYIGVSAGSILVHKTIEIAGWVKWGDINNINLKNLSGLNIINIAVYPHFKKIMKKSVNEFKKKADYPVIEIKDKQAVLVLGNKIKLIFAFSN